MSAPIATSAFTAIRYYKHQQVAQLMGMQTVEEVEPPFGTTNISKLHQKWRTTRKPSQNRHSVLQTSASCTAEKRMAALYSGHRHSVLQTSASCTTCSVTGPLLPSPAIRYYKHQQVALGLAAVLCVLKNRHSVLQTSASCTAGYIAFDCAHQFPPFGTTNISKLHVERGRLMLSLA